MSGVSTDEMSWWLDLSGGPFDGRRILVDMWTEYVQLFDPPNVRDPEHTFLYERAEGWRWEDTRTYVAEARLRSSRQGANMSGVNIDEAIRADLAAAVALLRSATTQDPDTAASFIRAARLVINGVIETLDEIGGE